MNEADREEIESIKGELDKAEISEVSRLAAHRSLTLGASAANGCKTMEDRVLRTAQAVFAGNVVGARTLIEVSSSVKSHASGCPLRSTGPMQLPGRAGVIASYATAVRPVAWPVSVAVSVVGAFGNLPAIIDAIKAFF